jgi:hypothetical protein
MPASPTTPRSPLSWRHGPRPSGWFMQRSHLAAQRRCCGIYRATRTASPSRTAGSFGRRHRRHVQVQGLPDRGPGRYTTMTLAAHEFIRRFLMHVLPKGLHRIRHYGLLANGNRADSIAHVRELLSVAPACCRIPVRAAVGACSSSRPSPPAVNPSIGPLRPSRRSGSIRHEDVPTTCSAQCRRCATLVIDRRCRHMFRGDKSDAIGHARPTTEQDFRATDGSGQQSRHQ